MKYDIKTSVTSRDRRAFSLIEVLLAIFILAIGVVSIASLFPAGIAQQRQSTDDITGPIVANNAIAIIRSKVHAEDFGTIEDHVNLADYGSFSGPLQRAVAMTTSGDWPWTRPTVMLDDDPGTNNRNERGAIDIFSIDASVLNGSVAYTTEYDLSDPLRGIPYNNSQDAFGYTLPPFRTPPVITQSERYYPMGVPNGLNEVKDAPRYVWDCMFRRSQGVVQVAIFVYRVTLPPSEAWTYSVPSYLADTSLPLVPFRVQLTDTSEVIADFENPADNASWTNGWHSYGESFVDSSDDRVIPFTAGTAIDPRNPLDAWQSGSQWLVDQNANVHRVLTGREEIDDDAVILRRPIPEIVPGTGATYFFDDDTSGADYARRNIVSDIWYIPTRVPVDTNNDGAPDFDIQLTPVYVTVKEL